MIEREKIQEKNINNDYEFILDILTINNEFLKNWITAKLHDICNLICIIIMIKNTNQLNNELITNTLFNFYLRHSNIEDNTYILPLPYNFKDIINKRISLYMLSYNSLQTYSDLISDNGANEIWIYLNLLIFNILIIQSNIKMKYYKFIKEKWKPIIKVIYKKDEIIGLIKNNKTINIKPNISIKEIIENNQMKLDNIDELTEHNIKKCIINIENILKDITNEMDIEYKYIVSIIINKDIILTNNTDRRCSTIFIRNC